MYAFAVFAAFPTPVKGSTKGGGRPKGSFMDVGKAANAAKTYIHINKYALNMHTSCIYFNIYYILPRNIIFDDHFVEDSYKLLVKSRKPQVARTSWR